MAGKGVEVYLDEVATSPETVVQAASQGRAEEQDVIQVTEQGHAWFACLLIVTEVSSVGVKAYLPQAQSASNAPGVYGDLTFGQFQRIGRAAVSRA